MKIVNGPKIRISDPHAVFSKGYHGAPEFTADDQSQSVISFPGFPMCIPGNRQALFAPLSNRPSAAPSIFITPDPLLVAPLQAGNFTTWQGIRKGGEVTALSIVVQNTLIQTLGDIVYVCMELASLGIDNPNPNTEIAETRFTGFISNSQATVWPTPWTATLAPARLPTALSPAWVFAAAATPRTSSSTATTCSGATRAGTASPPRLAASKRSAPLRRA